MYENAFFPVYEQGLNTFWMEFFFYLKVITLRDFLVEFLHPLDDALKPHFDFFKS